MAHTLILFLSLFITNFAIAEQTTFQEWPNEFRYNLKKAEVGFGQRFADYLFDSIDNKRLFEVTGQNGTSYGMVSGREVYDNHDVFQSYTVVDTLTLPFSLYSYGRIIDGTDIAFGLGIGGNFTFSNIRQISKSNFGNLERLEQRLSEVSLSDWFKAASGEDPNNPPYQEAPAQSDEPGFTLSSLNHARFSEMWNRVAFPARLPFKADWLSRLDEGEIITYGAEGFLELGPSLTQVMKLIEVHNAMNMLTGSLSYKLFVRGQYRIVILKENENFMRVKVTRKGEAGDRLSLGANSDRIKPFDGVAVISKLGTTIVPFNFENSSAVAAILEQGFRFDMRTPEGREAYEQAVIGRFAYADELAMKYLESGAYEENEAPIQRLFRRTANEESATQSRTIKLFLFSQNRASDTRSADSDVIMKSEKEAIKVFSSVTENRMESQVLLGSRENLLTRATIEYSPKLFAAILEGSIEDTFTNGDELNFYEDLVENILQRGVLFTRVPMETPDSRAQPWPNSGENAFEDDHRAKVNNYGRSSFYFRIDADETHIRKFLSVSEEERWKVLEKVFRVAPGAWQDSDSRKYARLKGYAGRLLGTLLIPLDLRVRSLENFFVADEIFERWQALTSLADQPKELVFEMGKLFSDTVFGPEMMATFTVALASERMPFFLTANNVSFGRINIREGEYNEAGKSLEDYRRAANVENPELPQNVNLTVADLRTNVLPNGNVEVLFRVTERPQFLYFRVDRLNMTTDTPAELIVVNLDQANIGENRIVFDPSESNYRGVIGRAFQQGTLFDLYVSTGMGRRNWGPVSKARVGITGR